MRDLDPVRRQRLVTEIIAELESSVPGSEVMMCGSLAEDRADSYSDIDLLWEIPDAAFAAGIANARTILEGVRPISSFRSDPDFQRSAKRRLFFVRFAGVPLFWRLDLDVIAASLRRDDLYDRDNPEARGSDWSLTESALMNAVAAIKAHLRGQPERARDLVLRGYERIGKTPASTDLKVLVIDLAVAAGRHDPSLRPLASEVVQLANDSFDE